jgi:uncharacterized protein
VSDERTRRAGQSKKEKTFGPLHDPENIEHHHAEGNTDEAVEVGHDPKPRLVPATAMVQHVFVDHEPGKQGVADGFGQRYHLRHANFPSKLVSQSHPGNALAHFGGIGRAQTIVVTAHPSSFPRVILEASPPNQKETMTIVFRAAEIPASDLTEKPLGQPSAEPLTGDITTRSHVFFTSPDERILSGTWECEPGASRWEFLARGEIIYVLSGAMTVQRDGGEAFNLTAGSSAIFELGWCGTWTVTETIRKVFVVYKP